MENVATSVRKSGTIFNIMRYSTQDGPGLRTTVFLKGCPLHCLWCHNPESISFEREFVWRDERCLRCEACVAACPEHAVMRGATGLMERDGNRCTWCGACLELCGSEARSVFGQEMESEDLMREILRDRPFFEESGGGVTFSGGEPLAQVAFLEDLLRRCRREAVHTAVDTSGAIPWAQWAGLLPLVDLWLYDLKCADDDLHKRFTGVSNALVLANLRRLVDSGAMVQMRIPLIPGFTDGVDNLQASARFLAGLGVPPPLTLLPFHGAAEAKYALLGRDYALANVVSPSEAELAAAASIFEKQGIKVSIGGNRHE